MKKGDVQPKKMAKTPTPAPPQSGEKKPKTPKTPTTPGAKAPASAESEATWKNSIVSYITSAGKSPLSKLGNECKRPDGLSQKLKAFISSNPDTFTIEATGEVALKK